MIACESTWPSLRPGWYSASKACAAEWNGLRPGHLYQARRGTAGHAAGEDAPCHPAVRATQEERKTRSKCFSSLDPRPYPLESFFPRHSLDVAQPSKAPRARSAAAGALLPAPSAAGGPTNGSAAARTMMRCRGPQPELELKTVTLLYIFRGCARCGQRRTGLFRVTIARMEACSSGRSTEGKQQGIQVVVAAAVSLVLKAAGPRPPSMSSVHGHAGQTC